MAHAFAEIALRTMPRATDAALPNDTAEHRYAIGAQL